MPLAVWHATGSSVFTLWAGLLAVLIWIRHRDNIRRLMEGREPLIWKD
jgi:glycerol-3-phosphate acyltransferase PlsY